MNRAFQKQLLRIYNQIHNSIIIHQYQSIQNMRRACKSKPRRLMSQIAAKLHYFTRGIQLSNKQLCSSSIAIIIMLQSSGFIPSTNARRKLVGGWPVRQSQATRMATRNNSNYSLNQPPQSQSDQSDQIR